MIIHAVLPKKEDTRIRRQQKYAWLFTGNYLQGYTIPARESLLKDDAAKIKRLRKYSCLFNHS